METIVFEVEFKDGSVFRVFCANRTQKKRFIESFHKIESLYVSSRVITSGIHTVAQWDKIIEQKLNN